MKKLHPLTVLIGAGILFSAISAFAKNKGLAAQKGLTEKDVDPSELAQGIKVEMEHTNDPAVAKQIALDHLSEDSKYYTKLAALGL